MPPLVVEVMNTFRQDILRREDAQRRRMATAWLQVERSLRDQVELFTQRVAADGLTAGQIRSRQFQLDRFASLLGQTRQQLDQYMDVVEPQIADQQRRMGAQGIRQASAAIRAIGTRIGFDVLPVGAIENLVGLAGDGSPLRSVLENSYGAGAQGMLDQLLRGVAQGKNPRVIARNMLRDGLAQTLNQVMVTARTEPLRVFREASRQQYQASGVVEGFRRLATKSSRTCPGCLFADGEYYDVGESLREHAGGRCSTVPVVTGFKPVQWETGKDWFRKQSPATQKKVLGPGVWNLWKDGKIELEQTATVHRNDIWGDSVRPTPLRELVSGTAQRLVTRGVPQVEPEPVALNEAATARQRISGLAGEYEKRLNTIDEAMGDKSFQILLKPKSAKKLQAEIAELVVERNQIRDELAQRGRALLQVPNPAQATMYSPDEDTDATETGRSRWRQGVAEFNKLVSDTVAPALRAQFLEKPGRAHYSPGSEFLRVANDAEIRTVVHEMGHWLENHSDDVRRKAMEFYQRRTAGDQLEPLGQGHYDWEMTRRDRFADKYMGHYYDSGDTEIVSMGLEWFFAQPQRLAAEDPDMFDFVYNLVRGQ